MNTSKLNSGGHPAMDLHPNQEREGISLDTSSQGNGCKPWRYLGTPRKIRWGHMAYSPNPCPNYDQNLQFFLPYLSPEHTLIPYLRP